MYGFDAARDFIIRQIDLQPADQVDPFYRIHLASRCQVGKWIHQAYASLCSRSEPLTAAEGEVFDFVTFTVLCKVREDIRVMTPKACNHGNQRVPSCPRCTAWYRNMANSALSAVQRSAELKVPQESQLDG